MLTWLLLSMVLLNDGNLKIEGKKQVDPARSLQLKIIPRGIDLRERFRGFAIADDYEDEKENCTYWLLTPKPCEENYRIAPFAFEGRVVGPVYFDNPSPREPVTGGMEVEIKKDLPPLSWKLVGVIVGGLLMLAVVILAIWALLKYVVRRVKEHRMSPIERAWVELDRLLQKGLPRRGKYKDFYIELTMVVRRYIQRKYGVNAPHLTTEEFLEEIMNSADMRNIDSGGLGKFLESADMVKFAGIAATPEMADEATESARSYLKGEVIAKRGRVGVPPHHSSDHFVAASPVDMTAARDGTRALPPHDESPLTAIHEPRTTNHESRGRVGVPPPTAAEGDNQAEAKK